MGNILEGKTIGLIASDGFEDSELLEPKAALEEEGAKVVVISDHAGSINGKNDTNVEVDIMLESATPSDYDGLLLPGGLQNPDTLRQDQQAISFIKQIADEAKPIAAICHAPWLLIEAGIVRGKTLTSWPSLKTDIVNAGGNWVDQAVVTDNGLVTSRNPDDIPYFNAKMIEEFAEGKHEGEGTDAV